MKAKWQLDPAHSSANFSVRHMMIAKVHGSFEKLTGSLEFDPEKLADSKVDAVIDTSSITTRESQRDAHLKSPDFFNVESFPNMTFKSNRIEKSGEGKYKVHGDLTIRDVTKPVILDVDGPSQEMKDPWGNMRIGASGSTRINRKDFGLNWNTALETGGFLVGDEVTITIDAQFVKQ